MMRVTRVLVLICVGVVMFYVVLCVFLGLTLSVQDMKRLKVFVIASIGIGQSHCSPDRSFTIDYRKDFSAMEMWRERICARG